MDISTLPYLLLGAFIIATIASIAGFGEGILILAVLSFFLDIKTTIAFSVVFFFFNNINRTFLFYKNVNWKFVFHVLIGAIPACFLGLYVFKKIDPQLLKYFLAFIGTYMIIDHFLKDKLPKIKNFTTIKSISSGAIYGFFTGVGNAAIIKALLLKWKGLSKETFVGTSVIISITMDAVKIPVFINMNLLKTSDIPIFIPLFFVSMLGSIFGKKILGKISHQTFEKIILVMIGLSVLKFLFV